MRVAICITVYNSVRFLGKQFYYLSQLDPKPDIVYFIENNSIDGTVEYIYKNMPSTGIPFKVISYKLRKDAVKYFKEHNGTAYDVIAIARQNGLNAFRRDGCDYGIFIDDDLYMLEKDAIKVFTTNYPEFDIIGGTYDRIYPEGHYVASKWKEGNGFVYKKLSEVHKPFDFPIITSGGCLCLSKRIIQDTRLNFYPVRDKYNAYSTSASEDYGYCLKAKTLGYRLVLDNSTKLYHMALETLVTKLHDKGKTVTEAKPWTMHKGKYIDFEYKV